MAVQAIAVPQSLAYVLNAAGDRNGVDFDYLLQTAMRESSLDPTAKAGTSSATGLFQFLSGTWMQVMKQEGPRLGYNQYADQIQSDGDGGYTVADPDMRAKILKLREDPQIASDLAAAYTKSNGDYLRAKFGRMPSAGELYIAHFLGAQGAEKMFTAGLSDPDQIAADLFPKQAAANKAIFYSGGQARTIRDVYRALVAKHDVNGGASTNFNVQQMASQPSQSTGRPVEHALPSRFSPENMSFTGLFRTEPETGVSTPLEAAPDAGGSAFFTQLYAK
ncbi:transglycosylase SLT domain-containing protein [Devosia sp.]|uniref:transglycosylase SLT domain-containing protein n=1 Tax=Devosia sp. TaxID=1871048 RepID=UPI003263B1B2